MKLVRKFMDALSLLQTLAVLFPKRSVKMIDGSEKCNRQLAFELQNSHVCEKRSNGPLRKQNFTLTGSQVMVSDL